MLTAESRVADVICRAALHLLPAKAKIADLDLNDVQKAAAERQQYLNRIREAARKRDILTWGKLLFPQKFSLGFCEELHGYFIKIRHDGFTCTEAPRGTAKTTIKCFLIPLFQALVEPETFKHYLNVQSTERKALAINRMIKKELETNLNLIAVYGDQRSKRWTDGQFILKNGVIFSCLGAGQSIRGIMEDAVRPDNVLVDDLYDREDIGNPEATKKKNEWFWGDLYPAMAQSGKTCMHFQGTAINKSDLLEELRTKAGIVWKSFKTILDFAKKLVIWPEQKSFDQVIAQRDTMPITIWEREFENKRRDDASALIKEAWLTGWEFELAWLHRQIREGRDPKRVENARLGKERIMVLETIRLGQDPSIGKNQKSDLTGTVLTYVTHFSDAPKEKHYWLVDVREARLTIDARCEVLKQIVEGRPHDLKQLTINIEAIGAFDDYATIAQQRVSAQVLRTSHVPDKLTNLENKSIHFSKQRVHLNAGLPTSVKTTIREQLINNTPAHDDVRDAILLTLDGPRKGPGIWVIE